MYALVHGHRDREWFQALMIDLELRTTHSTQLLRLLLRWFKALLYASHRRQWNGILGRRATLVRHHQPRDVNYYTAGDCRGLYLTCLHIRTG